MSDYRRFVSYIYLYENNVKSLNAGFVKVESRNGQCRLNLSLKNVYSVAGGCKVYLFIRMGQELRGIFIGEVQIRNHGSDWNFQTETENIAGSGYALDQMSGMIIQGEGNKFYGTRWDQGDLDLHRFVTEWKDEETLDVMETEVIETDNASETIMREEENDSDVPVKQKEMDPRRSSFAKIIEQCPGMYPFEDDDIEVCVRLEPQDIGRMPLDCWSYGSNSFLLHSYYSYRHLILARMKSESQGSEVYILGVPGTQHSRDAFMANMFGFRSFKPIQEGVENPSNFGYWYTIL